MIAINSIYNRILFILLILCIYNFSFAQCNAGILQTTGTVHVPAEETFFVQATDIAIPFPDGNFAWIFSNEFTNGTGGLNEYFVWVNNLPENNLNNNLNGYLSYNNFPKMQGTWVLYGAVVSDKSDPQNTICNITNDFLIINFAEETNDCNIGNIVLPGERAVCFGEDFTLTTTPSYTGSNGKYGWLFSNTNSNGTGASGEDFIIKSSELTTLYNSDLNGFLSINNLPVLGGTWVIYGSIFSDENDPINSICQISTDSLILSFNTEIITEATYENGQFSSINATGGTPPYGTYNELDLSTFPFSLNVGIEDANGCRSSETYPPIDPSTVSVADIEIVHQFSIFPNPISDGQLNVNLQLNANKNIKMDLMSIDGKMIQSFINENSKGDNYRFEIPKVATGLYFLKVNIEGQQFMEKIIIQ